MNSELLKKLESPFHPSVIHWKPGSVNKERTKALAMPYATLRAYQNRLDEVCGLDWAVSYSPWGNKLICQLTIAGITRSSTGESDEQSERAEIAGTAAEAQAFKRACSMFSLGRYLYHLPVMWMDYDATAKQFTDVAKAKLTGVIAQHYKRAAADTAQVSPDSPYRGTANAQGAADPGRDEAESQPEASPDGASPDSPLLQDASQPSSGTEAASSALAIAALNAKGQVVFGKFWESAKSWLTERYTNKLTPEQIRHSLSELNCDELEALTVGLAANSRYYVREWHKHRKAAANNQQAA